MPSESPDRQGGEQYIEPSCYGDGGNKPPFPSPVNSRPHSQEPLFYDQIDRPEGEITTGAPSLHGFIEEQYFTRPTDSQYDRQERAFDKGDQFDARIHMDATDQRWRSTYNYTANQMEHQDSYANPDSARTSPSDYLGASAPHSGYSSEGGYAAQFEPGRAAEAQEFEIEPMSIDGNAGPPVTFHSSEGNRPRRRRRHHGGTSHSSNPRRDNHYRHTPQPSDERGGQGEGDFCASL